jgi:hypothetical protein
MRNKGTRRGRGSGSLVVAAGAVAACLPLLASPRAASADPLVYDGFDYAAGSNMSTATPGAGTLGLSTAAAYGGQGVAGFTVAPTSLAFSNLVKSGGSITFVPGTNVAAASISLASSPYVGTLYNSYLVNLTTQGTAAGNGAVNRIANDNGSTGDRFNTQADSRFSSTNVAANYNGGTAGAVNATTGLTLGTNYLMIGRYTNVGTALTTDAPGVGTVYALTADQFDRFIAAGGTDAYLDAAAIGTDAASVTARVSETVTTGTFAFANGNFAALVAVSDTGAFDEMRYGTTLADVTPTAGVPEPVAAGLIGGLAAGRLLARRRPARRSAR